MVIVVAVASGGGESMWVRRQSDLQRWRPRWFTETAGLKCELSFAIMEAFKHQLLQLPPAKP